MDTIDAIAALSRLQRMDTDTVQAYDDAIGKIGDATSKQRLQEFEQDHQRHARELQRLLDSRGWSARPSTDEFERLMQGLDQQVRMAEGGDDAVMLAMDLAERAANAEYADALQLDLDDELRDLLQRNLDDEHRHLDFIESRAPIGNRMAAGTPATVGGTLETATTGEHGKPYEQIERSGGAGAYGGLGGDVGPGGGGGAATRPTSRDSGPGDVTEDRMSGRDHRYDLTTGSPGMSREDDDVRGSGGSGRAAGGADMSGAGMAGGGTGVDEGHPNFSGQVEGDSGSSGSGVAGSGSGD